MRVEDGKIVEITLDELYDRYLKTEDYQLWSFEEYIEEYRNNGCRVILK